jgi:hypothetical protein
MTHAHHQHGDDAGAEYLDGLFTVGVCGALGAVVLLLWSRTDRLLLLLHPKFHPWLLSGGITLLVLVAIRAAALWRAASERKHAAEHHDHEHCHGHGHCDHEGHEHGWAPWRYVVVLLPVVLFFLDLPDAAMSWTGTDYSKDLDTSTVQAEAGETGEVPIDFKFRQLENSANSPEARAHLTGRLIRLTGKFVGDNGRLFTLSRYIGDCCDADAREVRAAILVDSSQLAGDNYQELDPKRLQQRWIHVTGRLQYALNKRTNDYMPMLLVTPTRERPLSRVVEVMARPPANQFFE